MAVTLRFQGRFVHVVDKANKILVVVAPRFAPTPFGEHRPLMTIRHSGVLFKTGSEGSRRQVTTFDPAFRILSDDLGADDPQLMVWDLSGLEVEYLTPDAKGELVPTMNGGDKIEVVGIDALETSQKRPAKRKDELKPGTDWANAVVRVRDRAEATATGAVAFQFSRQSLIKAGQSPEPATDLNTGETLFRNPAEIVHVSVTPPAAEEGDDTHLLLRFKKGNKVVGDVCVRDGAIVCFSNACAPIHEPTGIDEEFSRFYDMLEAHNVDALIPFSDEGGLIEGIPCYQQSSMSF